MSSIWLTALGSPFLRTLRMSSYNDKKIRISPTPPASSSSTTPSTAAFSTSILLQGLVQKHGETGQVLREDDLAVSEREVKPRKLRAHPHSPGRDPQRARRQGRGM